MVTALLVASLLAGPPPALEPASLRARYAGLTALTAEITQVKEGRFWARPMRSSVSLRWTPRRVEWETRAPVRSLVVIEGESLVVTDARGATRPLGAAGDPRVQAIVGLLKAFLSLDLGAIERQYELQYQGRELVARLRPEAPVRVFKALRFTFDERLDLVAMELEADGERTRLTFDRLVREPATAGAP